MVIDLSVLPLGKRYEDTYGAYINIFESIAYTSGSVKIIVRGAPYCWVPLLMHLNCSITEPRQVFEHCALVKAAALESPALDRTAVEVLSSFRPETIDALWKLDRQWSPCEGRVRQYPFKESFIVTGNAAFDRPEVREYERHLLNYVPTKRSVVLVPCAADKPYPSPMHKAVLDLMPKDYYLMNVTGVLGLVPQALWSLMPHYDSGIPNRWRVLREVERYFIAHKHDHIIVYSDFYGEAIAAGLQLAGEMESVSFVIPPVFRADYMDLMDARLLGTLKSTFR